jgi:hypothetical protein
VASSWICLQPSRQMEQKRDISDMAETEECMRSTRQPGRTHSSHVDSPGLNLLDGAVDADAGVAANGPLGDGDGDGDGDEDEDDDNGGSRNPTSISPTKKRKKRRPKSKRGVVSKSALMAVSRSYKASCRTHRRDLKNTTLTRL